MLGYEKPVALIDMVPRNVEEWGIVGW